MAAEAIDGEVTPAAERKESNKMSGSQRDLLIESFPLYVDREVLQQMLARVPPSLHEQFLVGLRAIVLQIGFEHHPADAAASFHVASADPVLRDQSGRLLREPKT